MLSGNSITGISGSTSASYRRFYSPQMFPELHKATRNRSISSCLGNVMIRANYNPCVFAAEIEGYIENLQLPSVPLE